MRNQNKNGIMKNCQLFSFFLLIAIITSCNTEENIVKGEFEFIAEYSATVTVGGVVGITERTFKVGEVYQGTDEGDGTIIIRIAEHSELNDDCPNSWCYQEFLDVPKEYLKIKK